MTGESVRLVRVLSNTATQVVVRIMQASGASQSVTFHVVGVHD